MLLNTHFTKKLWLLESQGICQYPCTNPKVQPKRGPFANFPGVLVMSGSAAPTYFFASTFVGRGGEWDVVI